MTSAADPAPPPPHGATDEPGERSEHRWAVASVAIIALLVAIAAFAGLRHAAMPQTHVETVDPATLHLAGEFVEGNLGSVLEADGSVTLRGIGQRYSFTPSCLIVPAQTPITFRMTSTDVVHGFLVTGTNVNLMLVPGYISTIRTRFDAPGERRMPCHEFCGTGHEGMWGRVRIIEKGEFARLAAGGGSRSCAE
jgi:cytochrome c oxidase subunit 2